MTREGLTANNSLILSLATKMTDARRGIGLRGMAEKHLSDTSFGISDPLVLIYDLPDGEVVYRVRVSGMNFEKHGILVCDLVRMIAQVFKVDEDAVWDWVERERFDKTCDMKEMS